MNDKGQLSIIAALLVAVILIATVAATYSIIRNSPIQGEPPIQNAIDETNFAIKQVVGFTVGYYGSILQVTGNSTYANMSATNYFKSGLENIANMHPEWATSLEMSSARLSMYWFTNASYSGGDFAVAYNLTGLGISGINYATSCKLSASVVGTVGTQAVLNVTQDDGEPLINLGKQNFKFYRYDMTNSSWELASPSNEPTAYGNGTYQIDFPTGIGPILLRRSNRRPKRNNRHGLFIQQLFMRTDMGPYICKRELESNGSNGRGVAAEWNNAMAWTGSLIDDPSKAHSTNPSEIISRY